MEVCAYLYTNKTDPQMRGVRMFHDESCTNEHFVAEPLVKMTEYEVAVREAANTAFDALFEVAGATVAREVQKKILGVLS